LVKRGGRFVERLSWGFTNQIKQNLKETDEEGRLIPLR